MIKLIKSIAYLAVVLFTAVVFTTTLTGYCPGGPGCDQYSSDKEHKPETVDRETAIILLFMTAIARRGNTVECYLHVRAGLGDH